MRRLLAAFCLMFAAALAAAPAHAQWREASSEHFVIYSKESASSLEEFARKLERFDATLRYRSGLDDPPLGPANRLTVFVLPNVNELRRVHGSASANVGGFYIGRASGSYAFTPRRLGSGNELDMNAEIVLLHEYAHHFMLQNYSAAFPAWFIEGFAEFYSTARFEKDGSVGIGAPANHRSRNLFRGADLPATRMMSVAGRDLHARERESLYGRGWLLTHYLAFEPSRAGQLVAYLRALNSGKTSLEAASASFGDLKRLDDELDRYLLRRQLSYHLVSPDKIPIGNVAVRDLSPGASAMMDIRTRAKRGLTRASAAALVADARKIAAAHPSDALAQVTLSEVEFAAGNPAQAEAAADRALQADPKFAEALIYKGLAKLELAKAAQVTDPAAWRGIRRLFADAAAADPDDPEPKILFFQAFLDQRQRPTANAVEALIQAHLLAPQDDRLRWMVAHQHLRDGKAAEARQVLAPLAFNPHGGKAGEAAAAILGTLEAGGARAALEALEKRPEPAKDEADEA